MGGFVCGLHKLLPVVLFDTISIFCRYKLKCIIQHLIGCKQLLPPQEVVMGLNQLFDYLLVKCLCLALVLSCVTSAKEKGVK